MWLCIWCSPPISLCESIDISLQSTVSRRLFITQRWTGQVISWLGATCSYLFIEYLFISLSRLSVLATSRKWDSLVSYWRYMFLFLWFLQSIISFIGNAKKFFYFGLKLFLTLLKIVFLHLDNWQGNVSTSAFGIFEVIWFCINNLINNCLSMSNKLMKVVKLII